MIFVEKRRTKLFALPICFTTYTLSEEKITITSGFLNITVDDAYMYKVQDVKLTRSLIERLFGIGTITCYTGDTTHPELKLQHIRNSHKLKEYLLETSEYARRKRRMNYARTIEELEIEE